MNPTAIEISRYGSDQLEDARSLQQTRLSLIIARSIKQVSSIFRLLWKLGCDDYRRVIHGMKVGLALSLVCLLMILNPAYHEIGKNTVWAVMTVIVVFEFTAGATLSKGLNRGCGTFVAALLALGISHLSVLTGDQANPVIIEFSVFIIGAGTAFVRFVPKIKASFDYGVVVFLLTFSMILVLAYQDNNSVSTSLHRLLTICIGLAICLVVSLLVCPIWAGDDLQLLIVSNLHNLSLSLKASLICRAASRRMITTPAVLLGAECVNNYVSDGCPKEHLSSRVLMGEADDDPICNYYRGALLSSAQVESLANFASWEPPHGRFKLRHPWKKYPQVGVAMRHCAYGIVALHSCLHSDTQAPLLVRQVFKAELVHVATDAASVLQELSDTIKTMKSRSTTRHCVDAAAKAARNLHKLIDGRASTQPPSAFAFADAPASQPQKDGGRVGMQPSAEAASTTTPLMHRVFSWPQLSCNPGGASAEFEGLQAEMRASFLSVATFASLLVEVVARLGLVVNEVQDLAKAAHYGSEDEGDESVGRKFELVIKGRELSTFNNTGE